MLKRLYDEYNFPVELIIIKEYKRLNLSTKEMNVLLALVSMYKTNRIFSINYIADKVDYSQNDIANITESLLDKKFININLETNNNKKSEVFDLEGTFENITFLFNEDINDKLKEEQENDVSKVVLKFEQNTGRMIRNLELEKIRSWFEDSRYEYNEIIKAIDLASERTSIPYVERILSQEIPPKVEIDKKTDQALEELFKKL